MSSRDSYRPHNTRARSRSRSPPRSFTGNSDSRYRDRGFDFEHNRQLPERTREADRYREERDRGDSYRPRAGRGGRGGGRGGARGGAGGMGGAAPYWKKPPPPPAHDRPILNHSFREKTPELMPGMITGGFEVHAAEEEGGEEGGDAPMDLSDQEEEVVVVHAKSSEPAAAATKVPEEVATTEDAEHVAGITTTAATTTLKLPNGEEKKLEGKEGKEIVEVEKKKVDVIAMIRAAKAKAAKEEVRKDEVAAGDDFISFGSMALDDKPEKQKSEESDYDEHRKMRKLNDSTKAPLEAPRGPADPSKPFSFKEQLHGPYIPSVDEGPPGVGPLSRNAKLPPPPGPGRDTRKALGKRRRGHDDYSDSQDDYDQSLDYEDAHDHPDVPQNRKRKHDEISRGNNKIDGNIKWELRPKPGINHMPWMTAVTDHSKTLKLSVWLHMEMVDFVEYIKPRTYEHAVRRYVIQRLRTTINHLWDDTDVRVFGSFAAELYLPTSDVDLVVVSKDYVLTDQPKYSAKNRLYRVQDAIKNAGLATRGSVQTISGAKVPIVKYTDEATGLHVDISFENKSGLVANDTFKAWREKYPCLPILLTITKHFLSMRNLNEVYQGGIGSFTLCCLLISLLQQLPSVVSGVVSPSNNLGLMLLEFLELYGKRLNTRRVGIRVDPEKPGYFKKEDLFEMPRNPKPSDADLLVIQDPNNADNNISRSSFLIKTVMACFGEAYDALTRQMSLLEKMDFKQRKGRSLLAVLIGGDYREMEEQRERLRKVYVERIGDEADLRELKPGDVPPPPPPMFGAPPPPPPMATPASFPRNSNGSIGGRGGRGGAADRGRGSDRGRGAPRGRGAAQVGKGGGASKKQVVDLEEEEVFEKLRSNRGRRGGRGGGGKSDPVVLD